MAAFEEEFFCQATLGLIGYKKETALTLRVSAVFMKQTKFFLAVATGAQHCQTNGTKPTQAE